MRHARSTVNALLSRPPPPPTPSPVLIAYKKQEPLFPLMRFAE